MPKREASSTPPRTSTDERTKKLKAGTHANGTADNAPNNNTPSPPTSHIQPKRLRRSPPSPPSPPKTNQINGCHYYEREVGHFVISTTLRPIQEPRVFDYEYMVEEDGFIELHEKWHNHMYAPDIKFATDRMDLIIEHELLREYRNWVTRGINPRSGEANPETVARGDWYKDLGLAVGEEYLSVKRELIALEATKMTKEEIVSKKEAEEQGAPDPFEETRGSAEMAVRTYGVKLLELQVRNERYFKKIKDHEKSAEWMSGSEDEMSDY